MISGGWNAIGRGGRVSCQQQHMVTRAQGRSPQTAGNSITRRGGPPQRVLLLHNERGIARIKIPFGNFRGRRLSSSSSTSQPGPINITRPAIWLDTLRDRNKELQKLAPTLIYWMYLILWMNREILEIILYCGKYSLPLTLQLNYFPHRSVRMWVILVPIKSDWNEPVLLLMMIWDEATTQEAAALLPFPSVSVISLLSTWLYR